MFSLAGDESVPSVVGRLQKGGGKLGDRGGYYRSCSKVHGDSDLHQIIHITITILLTHRSYSNPSPPHRLVMDSISSFVTAVQDSLRVGTIRNCTFSIPFRTDVFNFLFNGKGSAVSGKRYKSYLEVDFNTQLFPTDWFVSYDKFGYCCKIIFPVFIHSYVKYAPKRYGHTGIVQSRDFTETITITVVKCRC